MQDVFGLIFANYTGTDFGELLSKRTIASLPYAGRYRLVDFPLSNMVNSGIGTVGLIMPSNYRSLIDHVGSGKQWNLDKKIGGLFILPGTVYGTHGTTQKFTLSDIIVNHRYIERRSNQNYAIITSASKVCNVDYSDMIEKHIKSGRAVTFAYYKADGTLIEDPADPATGVVFRNKYQASGSIDLRAWKQLPDGELKDYNTGDNKFNLYLDDTDNTEFPDTIYVDEKGDGNVHLLSMGETIKNKSHLKLVKIFATLVNEDASLDDTYDALRSLAKVVREIKKRMPKDF